MRPERKARCCVPACVWWLALCHCVAVCAPGWRCECVRLPGRPFPYAAPRGKPQARDSRPARAQLPAAQAVSSSSFTAGPGDSACNYMRPRRRCQSGAEVPRGRSLERGGPQAAGGETRPADCKHLPSVTECLGPAWLRARPAPTSPPAPGGAPSRAVADVRPAAPAGPKSRAHQPQGGASRALCSPGRTPGCGPPTCSWRDRPIGARVSRESQLRERGVC